MKKMDSACKTATPMKDFFDPKLALEAGGIDNVTRRARRNLAFGSESDFPIQTKPGLRRRSRSQNDIHRLRLAATNSPSLVRSPSCYEVRPKAIPKLKKPEVRRPFR